MSSTSLPLGRTCYPWPVTPPREQQTTTLKTLLTWACSRPSLSKPPPLPLIPRSEQDRCSSLTLSYLCKLLDHPDTSDVQHGQSLGAPVICTRPETAVHECLGCRDAFGTCEHTHISTLQGGTLLSDERYGVCELTTLQICLHPCLKMTKIHDCTKGWIHYTP